MIIIADIHLGRVNDSFMVDGVPSQTIDIRKRLASVLARAKLTKQCIVVAGDIFNRVNPTTQVITEFFNWLKLCKEASVEVFLISGNHDSGSDWTSMEMFHGADLSNVMVITELSYVTFKEDGYNRIALVWSHLPTATRELAEQGHGTVSKWAVTRYPKAEFIITHGTIVGESKYENDIFFEAGESMVIDPSDFSQLKLLVLGHIHEHRKSVKNKWVYPGSLTINNFGEVDEKKGWVEVDLKTLAYKWYAFPEDGVVPWMHVDIDLTDKDETALSEKEIEGLVAGAVVKIRVLAKAHGVVDEAYIKQLFNKYGYVTRFETIIEGTTVARQKSKRRFTDKELLEQYLKGVDAPAVTKSHVLRIGTKIIEGLQT
jgi:DNA repair exonuclease SbcCD nuclease subunit